MPHPSMISVRGAVMAVAEDGSGPPILFIHGFPFDRTMWQNQVESLPGWRRLAPDLRGFGLSDPVAVPQDQTIAGYADDLAALLAELGIGQAIVCGLSMGGYVAFELWRRHQALCRALILSNTRAEPDTPEATEQRDAMMDAIRTRGAQAVIDSMLDRVLAPRSRETRPDIVSHVRSMMARTPPTGMIAALAAMRGRADSTDLLGKIAVPTLIVAGSDDALIPVGLHQSLASRIPGARLEVITGAGHLAPLEQPDTFNRVAGDFLNSIG
ncbi:MAG: alpha/beta fold hydrolase [Gemmatimonadetes bacterium]|nr:alpha/beta fold hydrolase [Gemmatimonadota bacterium]